MESLGMGFVVLHENGSLSYVNQAIAELLELPVCDVEDRQASCFMDSDNYAALCEQLALRRQGSGAAYDLRLLSIRNNSTRVRIFPSAIVHEGRFLGSCGFVVPHEKSSVGLACRVPESLRNAAHDVLLHRDFRRTPELLAARLLPHEQEILERLAPGISTEDLARELGLSPATVRERLRAIYDKYGVRNRVELWGLMHVVGRRGD